MSKEQIKTYFYKIVGLERTITKSKDYWNTPKRIYVCWRGENQK